jgi:hypothetical protein
MRSPTSGFGDRSSKFIGEHLSVNVVLIFIERGPPIYATVLCSRLFCERVA